MRRVLLWGGILLTLSATALTMAGTLYRNSLSNKDESVQPTKRQRVFRVKKGRANLSRHSARMVAFGKRWADNKGSQISRPAAVRLITHRAVAAVTSNKTHSAVQPVEAMQAAKIQHSPEIVMGAGPAQGGCTVNKVADARLFQDFVASSLQVDQLSNNLAVESAALYFGSAVYQTGLPDCLRLVALDVTSPTTYFAGTQTSSLIDPPKPKPALQAVPEPSCLTMLLFGAASIVGTCRLRRTIH